MSERWLGDELVPRYNVGPKPPVTMDENNWRVESITPLRRRRLLQLAGQPFHHKAFYSQYCLLIGEGLCGWTIGFAYRLPAGDEELARLIEQGI